MTIRLEELKVLVRRVQEVRERRKLTWGKVRTELYHLSKTIPDMPPLTYRRLNGMVYTKTRRASNDLRKLVNEWLIQHEER